MRYMFSMDMTGENVRKTGGSFLIERWPDPGAIWERPWDPHTEWGRGDARADQLKGDLINDLHLAVCLRSRAGPAGRSRPPPYEGRSDHRYSVRPEPAVLDGISPTALPPIWTRRTHERQECNVGVAVAASAGSLHRRKSRRPGCGGPRGQAGEARLVEQQEGSKLAGADAESARRMSGRLRSWRPGASGARRPSAAWAGRGRTGERGIRVDDRWTRRAIRQHESDHAEVDALGRRRGARPRLTKAAPSAQPANWLGAPGTRR